MFLIIPWSPFKPRMYVSWSISLHRRGGTSLQQGPPWPRRLATLGLMEGGTTAPEASLRGRVSDIRLVLRLETCLTRGKFYLFVSSLFPFFNSGSDRIQGSSGGRMILAGVVAREATWSTLVLWRRKGTSCKCSARARGQPVMTATLEELCLF